MKSHRTASAVLLAFGLLRCEAAARAENRCARSGLAGLFRARARDHGRLPDVQLEPGGGARGYELSVFEVSELGWVSETPALRVELPPATGSWTPGAESCLEVGRRYAWRVQGLESRDRGEESALLLFEVRETAETASRVEALLRDLAAHLGVEVEDLRGRLAGDSAESAAESSPRLRAATDLETVEGATREVAATTVVGFSGNFSGRVHAQSGGGWWADLAGPGIGGTGPTGVTGWGQTGMFGYGDVTGVWGETGVPSGVGVRGNAWGGGTGVIGYGGGASHGVFGESVSGSGVYGTVVNSSVANAGVEGVSTNGRGVKGRSTNDIGVHGNSTNYIGIFGNGPIGVSGNGVTTGVRGTGVNFGVAGEASDPVGGEGVRGEGHLGVVGVGVGEGNWGGVFAGEVGGGFQGDTYGIYIDSGGCGNCARKAADRATVGSPLERPDGLPARALIATDSGAFLSNGGNWVNASDERVKENFVEVDREDLLARVDRLPIRTWNYIADGPTVRHIGPTAQDFQAAFELGGGDTAISTVDPAGIALATIQALYRENQRQQRAIDELRARLADVERRHDPAASRSTLHTP